MDSSSSIKREKHDLDIDMSLMSAPCPSSLIKESLKRNITARLSLNNHSLESSTLSNLNCLAFTSSLKKSTITTIEDDAQLLNNNNNLISNLNSHSNVNSNGKHSNSSQLNSTSLRNNSNSIRLLNNSNDVCALSNSDEHRTDEGYHSNGGQDELTPPEDDSTSSEDSDSENNYVLDFSVKGTSTKVLVSEQKKEEELEVSLRL